MTADTDEENPGGDRAARDETETDAAAGIDTAAETEAVDAETEGAGGAEAEDDASDGTGSGPLQATTAWTRNLEAPLRDFLRTEAGSASVLLAASAAALIWANADGRSYEQAWGAILSISLAGAHVTLDLRHWINEGLMAFFFLVIGLELRREFDVGDLRERRRFLIPLTAGVAGMAVPVGIFLAFNLGHGTAHGWGTAMSTDTAFALGVLALLGRRFPARLRALLLTIAVVDDLLALIVIAVVYSSNVDVTALGPGLGALAVTFALRARSVRNGLPYVIMGLVAWVAFQKSGVDPVVVGFVLGLQAVAYPAARADLQRASDLFRLFREQPTSRLAETARAGLRTAVSPNARLSQIYHPFTSYVIVPLFALANIGIQLSPDFLAHAYGSAVTLGIMLGYVLGKPIGITGATALVTRLSGRRIRPPVGWASVLGGGAVAGLGFTVSLLIAALAFRHGVHLREAKLGVLSAAVLASLMTFAIARMTSLLPRSVRLRALIAGAAPLVDLSDAVDPDRDHIRGPTEAPITLVEYGDYECPYCGLAEGAIRGLLADFGDVRYVWRHLPLDDVHPYAQLAAEAAEAAAQQGRFWDLHDRMIVRPDELQPRQLLAHTQQIGLDMERFREDLRRGAGAGHVADDVQSAENSDVSGTPTFFINGRRHHGPYDLQSLEAAVRAARARAALV